MQFRLYNMMIVFSVFIHICFRLYILSGHNCIFMSQACEVVATTTTTTTEEVPSATANGKRVRDDGDKDDGEPAIKRPCHSRTVSVEAVLALIADYAGITTTEAAIEDRLADMDTRLARAIRYVEQSLSDYGEVGGMTNLTTQVDVIIGLRLAIATAYPLAGELEKKIHDFLAAADERKKTLPEVRAPGLGNGLGVGAFAPDVIADDDDDDETDA